MKNKKQKLAIAIDKTKLPIEIIKNIQIFLQTSDVKTTVTKKDTIYSIYYWKSINCDNNHMRNTIGLIKPFRHAIIHVSEDNIYIDTETIDIFGKDENFSKIITPYSGICLTDNRNKTVNQEMEWLNEV